jgi:RHS repeat-associated protein
MLADHLGTIAAETDNRGTRIYRGWFSPYGAGATSTGEPGRFGWIGSYGYRDAAWTNGNHPATNYLTSYVRARHYSRYQARWTTVDPLYPDESSYGYVGGRPVSLTDIRGLGPCFKVDKDCAKFGPPFSGFESKAKEACEKFVNCLNNKACKEKLQKCVSKYECSSTLLGDMKKKCDGTHCVDIWCCKKGCCGCDGTQFANAKQGSLLYNCGIRLCYNFAEMGADQVSTFLHEISHCSGTDDMTEENQDGCNAQNIQDCLRAALG